MKACASGREPEKNQRGRHSSAVLVFASLAAARFLQVKFGQFADLHCRRFDQEGTEDVLKVQCAVSRARTNKGDGYVQSRIVCSSLRKLGGSASAAKQALNPRIWL
jgi:hypothetical protein